MEHTRLPDQRCGQASACMCTGVHRHSLAKGET